MTKQNGPVDAGDLGFSIGSAIASSIREAALTCGVSPAGIVEALPVVIVELLTVSTRPDKSIVDVWELLLPFIMEQVKSVERSRRLVARRSEE